MRDILLIQETRTEHAKEIRRQTGSNSFRDKEIHFRVTHIMQCIGTFLTKDNLLCVRFL